jgi:hypothetical protein
VLGERLISNATLSGIFSQLKPSLRDVFNNVEKISTANFIGIRSLDRVQTMVQTRKLCVWEVFACWLFALARSLIDDLSAILHNIVSLFSFPS